jgi:hypothetical protein
MNTPLDLASPIWRDLQHAYGSAEDVPGLLTALEALPPRLAEKDEPYSSLWSALCHQGDAYTASYAAVPHIVRIAQSAPSVFPWTLLALVSAIEISRSRGSGPVVPGDLLTPYTEALAAVPALVAAASTRVWDHWFCLAALSAVAAAKGSPDVAEAVLELNPETLRHLLDDESENQGA